MSSMPKHALLSASGSERWSACTPSAKLGALFPEVTSTYAEEGTRAHAIAEQILSALNDGMEPPVFTDPEDLRIEKEVKPYTDHVWKLYNELQEKEGDAVLFLETRVRFDNYVPAGFGTADTIILAGNTLYLIDLKFGAGTPVNAENNSQLQLYGLGALNDFKDLYGIEQVTMQIVQPRITTGKKFSEQTKTVEELTDWAENEVRPKALEAMAGTGTYVPGEHCQFCKARDVCRARAEHFTEITALQHMKPKELIDNGSLAKVLREKSAIEKWLKQLEKYAVSEMQKGVEFKGLKLVAGRSSTVLTKPESELAKKLVEAGVNEALLWKPKEMVCRSDLKDLVGDKEKWAEIEKEFYKTTPGKPKTDKAESKAKAYEPENDFANIDAAAFKE